MKPLLTTIAVLLPATAVSAHPGHDHTYWPGGEQHHLLWIGLLAVGVFGAGAWWLKSRRTKR